MNRFASGLCADSSVKDVKDLSQQMQQRLPVTVNMDEVAAHTLCLPGIDSTICLSLSLFRAGQVSLQRGVQVYSRTKD